jgi:hypothetical protein
MAEPTTALSQRQNHNSRPAAARWVFGALFLFSLLFFLVLLRAPRADGQIVGSDGTYYYVYVRSLVIDRDLSFANEYAYYRLPAAAAAPTPTGLAPNKYAIGPAILWMPFFLAAHLVALIAGALGLGVAADGYGYLYQSAISIGSIVYGTLGFWLAYLCSRRVCGEVAAAAAVALLWLASNAFYYMVFEPSMSHMVSLFSVALLLTVWFLHIRAADTPSLRAAAALGVAGGLVLLVRLQDGPFLLLPYSTFVVRLIQSLRGDSRRAWGWLSRGAVVGAATFVVFIPQLLVWRTLFGTWTVSPYWNDHNPPFYWLQPQIAGVLGSTFHGLFSWHPVFLFALVGLLLGVRRDRPLVLGSLLLLAIQVYIVAAWWSWWQGDSFGGRMFLNAIWIWVLGLALLLERLRARRLLRPALVIGVVLVGWNALSLVQYRLGFVPMGRPLTWEQMTIDRLRLPWTLLSRLRHR